MKSHLSGGPGEYIWDEIELLFVGRLNKDGTEDHRFTADGRSSFLNGVCKGFSLSSPQKTARLLTEPEYNGYIIRGFSLLVDGATLTPEMWVAKAGEELQKEGIYEILEELGKWKGKERKLKEDTLRTVFKKEIRKRGMQNDPEFKKACAREKAVHASDLYPVEEKDDRQPQEILKVHEKPKKFYPKLTKDEAWELFINAIHYHEPVRHRDWGRGFKGSFNSWKKNVFNEWQAPEYKWNSNLFIEVMIEEIAHHRFLLLRSEREMRHITHMVKEIWNERYGYQDAKGTTKIVVKELFDDSYAVEEEGEKFRLKLMGPSEERTLRTPFGNFQMTVHGAKHRHRQPHRHKPERYSVWKAN